jgi:hypothetical protein
MPTKRKIKLLIIIHFLNLSSFGQSGTIDSSEKCISKKLLNRGYYTVWEGQPWEYQNGTEVPGYTDLDRRILFSKDFSFEEVVFKDRDDIGWIDTCDKMKLKVPVYVLYSGVWKINGDTILLRFFSKMVYPQMEFDNCFYLSKYKKFKCNIPPLCNLEYTLTRMFFLKNEELQEIGNFEYHYK